MISKKRWRRTRSSPGYGLVELIVTMTLMAVVLGAAFYAFFRCQDAARRMTSIVEARQNARAAVQLLERELRMAGSGWGRIPVNGSLNGAPLIEYAVAPGYGGPGANDSLAVLGGWGVSTALRSPMPSSSAILQCVSVQGFTAGDFAVITNGAAAHLFQVTAAQSPPENLQHNPSSAYNVPGGHNDWPAGGYGADARVYRVTWVSYTVDTTSYRRPCLVRREQGLPPQVVASDVSAFEVWYRLQDGTLTRDPEDLSLIDKIRPVIQTRVSDPRRPALVDSAWAMVRPRTF